MEARAALGIAEAAGARASQDAYSYDEKPGPMRGTVLWFNEVKDLGVILTEEGERLPVAGGAFVDGMRPKGRCARAVVSFEVTETEGVCKADEVVLVPAGASPRRARLHHRPAAR